MMVLTNRLPERPISCMGSVLELEGAAFRQKPYAWGKFARPYLINLSLSRGNHSHGMSAPEKALAELGLEASDVVSASAYPFIWNAANEGIPVAATARVFMQPFALVHNTIKLGKHIGSVAEVPSSDWPPTGRNGDRVPVTARKPTEEEIYFESVRRFKLPPLEGRFLSRLLLANRMSKSQLHNVAEAQRLLRQQQPNSREETGVKMVDVIICKLRKAMKKVNEEYDEAITTLWGDGYYIDAPMKARVLSFLFNQEVAVDRRPEAPTASPGLSPTSSGG
jgi:hypothetical protein